MNSRLPEEKLFKLLPCLKRLAELVSGEEIPSRHELTIILSENGIDVEDWALDELAIWCQILVKNKGNLCANNLVVTELESRGIPKFPAMLAFDLAKPKPMIVEPQFIDFGCLEIGEEASKMLTVTGEHVNTAESSSNRHLKITLLAKSNTTLIQIRADNGNAGETIKDEILLRGNSSELRVPITVRWKASPPNLSWCPECKILKKSLFYNQFERKYECLNLSCRREFPYPDKKVSEYNESRQ